MKTSVRNILIFCMVSLGAGFAGIGLDRFSPPADPMQGLGALVWLASPVLAVLLLRGFGGDGWADFGLGLNLKSGWRWHLAGLAIPVLVSAVTLALAAILGPVSGPASGQFAWGVFASMLGVGFVSVAVKNIFEEFAWRGYLSPRLEALGLHPFANALLTGLIWAGWHVPYYLYFLNPAVLAEHTSLSVSGIILLAFIDLPFHALAYAELRRLSRSTWTAWLMHNAANALSMTLVTGGFISLAGGIKSVFFTPGTQGVIYSLLMGLVGLGLYTLRKPKSGALPVGSANFAGQRG